MTAALAVKVFDGIVLATDSATTLPLAGADAQVYINANKIFPLHRTKPVAAMTWGLGAVGSASIATLAKDLRRRFMGRDLAHPDWDYPEDYTVEAVAEQRSHGQAPPEPPSQSNTLGGKRRCSPRPPHL